VYAVRTLSTDTNTHAQTLLDAARQLGKMAVELQPDTEPGGCIPVPLVERLREAGLYRMLLPRNLGGLQLDIPSCYAIVEAMAEADGSVGWNLMNNAIIQLSCLAFSDAGVDELFGNGTLPIIAGTLVPGGGQGTRVEGGYVVSGRWRFGSGCSEARWMIGNFDVAGEDGSGVYRVAFPVDEVTIYRDTWEVTGMRGTGSYDWSVTDVFVPDRRVVFVPGRVAVNQWRRWEGTLYQLPVHTLIGPHHSMIATGIARAGIDAFAELAGAKVPRGRAGTRRLLRDEPQVQDWIARAEAHLEGGRAFREAMLREVWATADAGETVSLEQRARCRLAGSFAADSARTAMDLVYRGSGTTATQRAHRLAHCWRDLQVVSQAAAVNPDWYPVVGRVLLGLEPGSRLS
jgi:alkylation response protein AidB-like acyl-CoA dehydrogenase